MGFRPRAILRSVVVALVGIPAGLILWHNPNVQNNTLVLSTMYVPTNKEWLHNRFIQYMRTVQYHSYTPSLTIWTVQQILQRHVVDHYVLASRECA